MILALAGAERITTSAFDKLEAAQIAEDAQRVRLALDNWSSLLHSYGATNSIWDASFDDVARGDQTAFTSDFPPADLTSMYSVDAVIGVGLDGSPRVGGLADGDSFAPLPAGVATATDLARLFDPAGEAGVGRCGVVVSADGPYLYCGFAAHDSHGSDPISGGLIFLRALDDDALSAMSEDLGMPVTLVESSRPGATAADPMASRLGELAVSTAVVSSSEMALQVAARAVGDDVVHLEARRERLIHATAVSSARKLMTLMAALGAAFLMVVLLVMRNEVGHQITPLRDTAESVITSGDRTLRIDSRATGPVGALAATIDRMLDAMAQQDEELQTAHQTHEARARQAFVQQRLARHNLRKRAQEAVDETTTAAIAELRQVVEQLGAFQESVTDVATRAHTARNATEQVNEHARTGGQTAQAVAESLHQVSGITKLIAGVAGQTNMLALNATIESARAGEAGKGFAVVAGEVKQLAQTTSTSTEQIASTLAALERDVSAMSNLIHGMTEGVAGIAGQAAALSQVAAVQRSSMASLDGAVQNAMERLEAMAFSSRSLERRAHERIVADGVVTLTVSARSFEARLLDISEGGLRAITNAVVPCGQGSRIEAVLQLGQEQAVIAGEVVRCTPSTDGGELGVRFLQPDARDVALVREYIEAVLRDED
jgi:methyl-accepting chemotaxis protein